MLQFWRSLMIEDKALLLLLQEEEFEEAKFEEGEFEEEDFEEEGCFEEHLEANEAH